MAFGFLYTLPTITGSHIDYPLLLKAADFPATAIDGSANALTNGGGDLVVYTNASKTTQLPVDVVNFVSGGTPDAEVWVSIPIAATGNTVYIEKSTTQSAQPAPSSTFGSEAVWADYEDVTHDGGKTSAKGLTTVITGSPTDVSDGKFTNAQNFGARSDNYRWHTVVTADVEVFTMQSWVRDDDVGITVNFSNSYGLNSSNRVGFGRFTLGDANHYDAVNSHDTSTTNINTTNWESITSVYDFPTERLLYVSGVEVKSDTTISSMGTGRNLFMQGGMPAGSSAGWEGDTCESRLRFSILSPDWLLMEYNNQNASTAWGTLGAWADSGGGSDIEIAIAQTLNSFTQSIQLTEISDHEMDITQNLNSFTQSIQLTEVSDLDINIAQTLNAFTQSIQLTEISDHEISVSQNLNSFTQSIQLTEISDHEISIAQTLNSFTQFISIGEIVTNPIPIFSDISTILPTDAAGTKLISNVSTKLLSEA